MRVGRMDCVSAALWASDDVTCRGSAETGDRRVPFTSTAGGGVGGGGGTLMNGILCLLSLQGGSPPLIQATETIPTSSREGSARIKESTLTQILSRVAGVRPCSAHKETPSQTGG